MGRIEGVRKSGDDLESLLEVRDDVDDVLDADRDLFRCVLASATERDAKKSRRAKHTRIKSGVTPAAACSFSSNCWCVVVDGWITNVFASPTFAKLLASLKLSTTLLPTCASPFTPKLNTPPNKPFLSSFLDNS